MRLTRVLAVALGGGILLLPGAAGAVPGAKPGYVGIVIGSRYGCVRWHAGITGDDVLNTATHGDVTYRSDGIVLTIDGKPDPPHADDTHYWSYWHDTGGAWHYSDVGASGYQPKPGTVEGWNFDDGHADAPKPAAGPAGLYASICGAKDTPTPTSTATPTRTVPPTHHATTSAARATRTQPAPSTRPPAPSTAIRGSAAPVRPTAPSRSSGPHPRRTHRDPIRARTSALPPPSSPPESATPAAGSPAAQSLRPLPGPADTARSDSGSPLPLILGSLAVAVIAAAAAVLTIRRRRAD